MARNILKEDLIERDYFISVEMILGQLMHEITPTLRSLNRNIQFISKHSSQNKSPQEYSGAIKQSEGDISRIFALINASAQLYKRTGPGLFETMSSPESNFEVVSINSLVEISLLQLKLIEEQQFIVNYDYSKNIYLNCNSNELIHLFTIILKNAIEAKKDSRPEILIRTYKTKIDKLETVNIEFIDNGIGIEKSYLENIFDYGFSTKIKGAGLGLGIAKDIINKYNGLIKITSPNTNNHGTRIKISFNTNRNE